MESPACLMQETAADKLPPILVKKLHHGADLKQLVAAAALANARSFGGEDYVGFQTMMALARVTASAYGYAAPGYSDACGLLKV